MASRKPSIRRVAMGFGSYPRILPLNPEFRPDSPLLKLELSVLWSSSPNKSRSLLADVQERLARFSPSFLRHRCGGVDGYHVHALLDDGPGTGEPAPPPDAALALAHLIEHAIIDVVAKVAAEPRVSGITAARHKPGLFDIFVECPAHAVAVLAADVALSLVRKLIRSNGDTSRFRHQLELATHLYERRDGAVDLEEAARIVQLTPARTLAALRRLEVSGFALLVRYDMNFSGVPRFAAAEVAARRSPGVAPRGRGA